MFEQLLRQDGHRPLLEEFERELGYDVRSARVVNIRNQELYGKTLRARAEATERFVRAIVEGAPDAANLLDGAVLTRSIGGATAYFEADAIAARFDDPIHVGEIKSFPTVDGQADPDKVGAAVAQAAIYILLTRSLVDRVGGDADMVSDSALLITPRNTGLQPTMTIKAVGREIERATRILDRVPNIGEIVASVPTGLPTFAAVASKEAPESRRVEAALAIAEGAGTNYQPSCLSSCGMARLCRERAHFCGSPARFGRAFTRLLPGVESLDRVTALARGAPANEHEAPVAEQLIRAERLLARARRE
jgi:hypothetical protein